MGWQSLITSRATKQEGGACKLIACLRAGSIHEELIGATDQELLKHMCVISNKRVSHTRNNATPKALLGSFCVVSVFCVCQVSLSPQRACRQAQTSPSFSPVPSYCPNLLPAALRLPSASTLNSCQTAYPVFFCSRWPQGQLVRLWPCAEPGIPPFTPLHTL